MERSNCNCQKKNGDLRICVDYRELNAVTIRPIFPIPEPKEMFDVLGGSQFYSSIDLSSAYHQIAIKEEDKEKTAFSTRSGQFVFNQMPFGLNGAPATFQRMMNLLLKSENWRQCLVYSDDILVFGSTFEEHVNRLSVVFGKLYNAGIKLSPEKCQFLKSSLTFFGSYYL